MDLEKKLLFEMDLEKKLLIGVLGITAGVLLFALGEGLGKSLGDSSGQYKTTVALLTNPQELCTPVAKIYTDSSNQLLETRDEKKKDEISHVRKGGETYLRQYCPNESEILFSANK